MIWAVLALGLAVVAGGAWLLGRPREQPSRDDDLEAPRAQPAFRTRVRGYRREQVEAVVGALQGEVVRRGVLIAELSGDVPPGTSTVEPDESPPVRGPAAGETRRPTAGRPAPLRALDLLAVPAYLAVATYVLSNVVGAPRDGYLSQGVQDQQAFEWYFGATAHNLVTLSNPLFTDLQNAPDGVNLMANASVLGLGIPLAPLTLLAGPSATFLVVELLGLAGTALAWFWLFRRWLPVHAGAAFLGGLLAGFAPGLVSHANGHPNFVAQMLVPVILDRLIRLADGRHPIRDGVVLGLLLAWQVLIGEEVLLLATIGICIGGLVLLAHGRVPLRVMLPGLGVGAALALALVAVPLWWQFFGPQSYTTIWHPPAGNDLAQLWSRATRTVGADPFASAAVSMNRTEENSFFGIPLLLGAAAVVAFGWRRPVVRALGAVVVLSCWLSLGEEVTVNGTATGIPGPWRVLEALPVVQNVLPTRLALVAVPALAALLAIGVEMVRVAVSRYAGDTAGLAAAVGAGVLVLLPVVPTPLVVDPRPPVPQFFSDGSWETWVDDGSVYAVPPPNVADARALEWQAEARWGFPLVAGYFVGPGSTPDRVGQYGATPSALTQWIGATARDGVTPPVDAAMVDRFEQDLVAGRVDAVVLPDERADAPLLLDAMTSVLGTPVHEGGVHVWDVRGLGEGRG